MNAGFWGTIRPRTPTLSPDYLGQQETSLGSVWPDLGVGAGDASRGPGRAPFAAFRQRPREPARTGQSPAERRPRARRPAPGLFQRPQPQSRLPGDPKHMASSARGTHSCPHRCAGRPGLAPHRRPQLLVTGPAPRLSPVRSTGPAATAPQTVLFLCASLNPSFTTSPNSACF